MPAARVFSTTVCSTAGSVQPSLAGQPQELLMTLGDLDGSGFRFARFVGAMNHSKNSVYVAGVPAPWSMLRQPIHFAEGATPILLAPPSSPTIVPIVWVPWPKSSQGTGETAPHEPPPEWM